MTSEAPVAYDDLSEARKATQAAISRACPGRPSGNFGRSMDTRGWSVSACGYKSSL
jgi:hypothetical protein